MVIDIGIFFYMIVFLRLPRTENTSDWEVLCPRLVPFATIVGILVFVFIIIGMWPVWSWLSPILIGILFMAFIESLQFM